jgi:hypothetical protein
MPDQPHELDQGASSASLPTALSSSGSSPVPGLAADALQSTGAAAKYTWVGLAKDNVKGPPWNYYVLDLDGREMALCQMPDGEAHAEQIVDALNHEDDKFNLRWNADMRAIKRWQDATGQTLTWPDHADLVVWLLEQLEPASADTHPEGGDAVAAPFMSGAVGAEGAETPNPSSRSSR